MPCNSEHMEASQLEIECSRILCMLDEIAAGKSIDIDQVHWRGYHPGAYNKATRSMLNELTTTLSLVLTKAGVENSSLEIQMWWRDHQKADAARIARKEQAKAARKRELQKIIDEAAKELGELDGQ